LGKGNKEGGRKKRPEKGGKKGSGERMIYFHGGLGWRSYLALLRDLTHKLNEKGGDSIP